MGKINFKTCKTRFAKGNNHSPRTGGFNSGTGTIKYVRLEKKLKTLVQTNPLLPKATSSAENSDQEPVNYKLLRSPPKDDVKLQFMSDDAQNQSDKNDCYKLFHISKLWEMVNEVSREHRQKKPDCQGNLCFDSSSSMQWGFGWRESAKCQICTYVSKRYKLYAEIDTCKRGVKPASVTRGISIALTQTPIASSGVRKICHGGNIPAPSVACLQRTANLVNEVICKENKRDMKRIREELKEINKYRGLPQNVINVQADGMYNNNLYSGVGKTPFQPATQASYTVAETITSKKQIVAAEQVNKLCSKHGFHTQEETECDNKSGPCSATASIETTIGDEYRWAKSCFLDLHHDGLEVKYLTTDADSGAFRAATDLYDNKITSTEPVHQLDTRHLAENHRKQMNSCSRLLNMMPGHNVEYRKYLRNRFALDLSRRCTAEFESVFTKENGDFSKITEKLKYLVTAIKRCYAGDHYGCNLHSRVCKGAKKQ
ncbi:uncharacterized protein LOC132717547 [Ruditapes philippinarum]|uniref:uncharacterized protein LOC132717547 n=1 Tax=Ruditapes philippinarum TaxID=129788 RepID=UPI00295ACC07|nr:uncharacterized protein LOC132717547 [Ruditapes philippinarum]